METAKVQGSVRWVDPIDELFNLANYLHFITDMFPQNCGETLNFSLPGQSGFQSLLMEIAERIGKAADTLHKTQKDQED
jgi:hypothetical protein